jgi:hypothetical protein
VEKWIPQTKRRVDLFGCIDIVAIGAIGCVGIQATSTGNMASRVTKSTTDCAEALTAWLKAQNTFEVWGWAKRGAVGKRKLWTLRIIEIRLIDGFLVPCETKT